VETERFASSGVSSATRRARLWAPDCALSDRTLAPRSVPVCGVTEVYERQSGDKVLFNFGASSLLARQIEEGAPADIFFSADEAKMDGLEAKGLVVKETRKSRLSNTLVIVVATEKGAAIESPKDLTTDKVKRLALAEPRTVPAGIYAKEYLQKQNLWAAVESKVVPTENVRAALSAVEAGNAEAGIVYKTDAAISKKTSVAYEVPARDSPAISYPVALVKESKQAEAAKKFLQHLDSAAAARAPARVGGSAPSPTAPRR